MRVLVTGGGGFAGRHLLRALCQDGYEPLSATVLESPPTLPIPGYEDLGSVDWLSMDTTSPESIRRAVSSARPELVFHLAGQSSVGRSFDEPVSTWEVNATGTLRLLAALGEADPPPKRVLLVSSAEVYGVVDPAGQPITEEAELRPVSPYGLSKAAAELAALQMSRSTAIEVVIARSFNHIGPGQDERFVMPSIAIQLMGKAGAGSADAAIQVGNLDVERDMLDVRDVARAYIRLMEAGANRTAYNVSSGTGRSLQSMVDQLVELSGTNARIEVDPERVRSVDIQTLVGDPGRLRALGWEPRFRLEETLGDLLAEGKRRP